MRAALGTDAVSRNDVDRLLAHSRFRGDRFARSELTLEGSPGQSSRGLASHLTDWLT